MHAVLLHISPWLRFSIFHTYVTYAMLHGDTNHLLENTLLLIIFGPSVEGLMGGRNYALTTAGIILVGALAATTLVLQRRVQGGGSILPSRRAERRLSWERRARSLRS